MTLWHWLSFFCPEYFPAHHIPKLLERGLGQTPSLSSKLLTELGFDAASVWASRHSDWETKAQRLQDEQSRIESYCIGIESPDFPERLRHQYMPPAMLFCQGASKLLCEEKLVAVVGARHPTRLGTLWVRREIPKLCDQGVVTVSGGARGIDSEVHESSLVANGRTVVFLPGGLDAPYPQSNLDLFSKILERGGLLVTEFPPRTVVRRHCFHRRNRLIAGVSKLVVVVEAGIRSGTMMTANKATSENIDIAVLPGPPGLPTYDGSLQLIWEGAKIVRDSKDIEELLTDRSKSRLQLLLISPNLEKTNTSEGPA